MVMRSGKINVSTKCIARFLAICIEWHGTSLCTGNKVLAAELMSEKCPLVP